jgi:hypothetical protein
MASGGYRPGAGRPRGAKNKTKADKKDDRRIARNMSPLDYMLSVMRDEDAESSRRDRMAMAAAPYVHDKPSDHTSGKKEILQQEAQNAPEEWGNLLH